ncbi:MAG: hypothetical protein A2504_09775 [Bdellovibrionales bacterium RIFOXYD12_FULL_39_22]|nr:MAG: hypothetical protein A2385_13265 [Bdellovibrionales bacterium RIFOXYB1_FULL_39_21]OFZ41015.1 MAG: hypothetical protein A2485_16775 [Bdellovibrionales bacterium RIFOXYC12_FULL_39_17]OFZ44843.1 MAG: hypothetical protein A2404_10065 [Bdellovibrionales bacterium RIFOXYC1_FULL_39_130]OFZ68009.1 MAG: hypothetical protein A2451_14120 [Bdellovibrionales bacterium RIFOXYC2_FULL_39_8]OFZ74308.1 MAG: hypothetical protein A2560_17030 [Bdellovibrionales bacterium RIFOXYD1_FULL_39_84]OFZ92172.1 MAG:
MLSINKEAVRQQTSNQILKELKSPSFEDVIFYAIEQEGRAHDQFSRLSKKVKNKKAREILNKIAQEELEHLKELENLLDAGPDNFQIPKIEYHSFLEEKQLIDKITPDASVQEALLFAIGHEHATYNLYKDLAHASDSVEARDTFVKLSRMEIAHKIELENWYKQLCLQ